MAAAGGFAVTDGGLQIVCLAQPGAAGELRALSAETRRPVAQLVAALLREFVHGFAEGDHKAIQSKSNG